MGESLGMWAASVNTTTWDTSIFFILLIIFVIKVYIYYK